MHITLLIYIFPKNVVVRMTKCIKEFFQHEISRGKNKSIDFTFVSDFFRTESAAPAGRDVTVALGRVSKGPGGGTT